MLKITVLMTTILFSVLAVSGTGKTAGTTGTPDIKHTATAAPQKARPLQTTCPIMGNPVNKDLYVEYKGKRIYVCCEGCIDAVKNDPEAAIKKIESSGESVEVIAAAQPAENPPNLALQTTCPVMKGNPINRNLYVDYQGKRIYVCCSDCLAKVKAAPGKYIGILTGPLRTAAFEPDMVMIYSNTAQLREMIGVAKNIEKTTVKSEFDPIDSCAYAIVPVIEKREYRITLPDPGERSRAFAEDDEIIFSVPAEKMAGLVEGVKKSVEMKKNPEDWSHLTLRPDFPRPPFYTELFRKWGLDVEN